MFHQLPSISLALAAQLEQAVPRRSGRLVLKMRSQFWFTVVYLSLLQAGLTVVPVSRNLPALATRRIFDAADADAVVTDIDDGPTLPTVLVPGRMPSAGSAGSSTDRAPESAAAILFTSGTTSEPKGVMLSAQNLMANAEDIASAIGAKESRFLSILPLHHTNGQLVNILVPFLSGSTVYCGGDYSLTSLTSFWSLIEEKRIEYVDVVPTVIMMLLALPPHRTPDVSSLKYVICGGAPIPEGVITEFERVFGTPVLQEYGLTEATCISSMETPTARRLGTVGRPLRRNQVEIRAEDGRVLGPERPGELWIRGDYTMLGYLGGGSEYELPVRGEWLDTGDIGVLDQDGFLTIRGRRKNIIIKGAQTIIPEDIERAARHHPAVLDACAVGRANDFYGEIIDLCVLWRGGSASTEDLWQTLRSQLPKEMLPDNIRTVDRIPRTDSGKIIRRDLETLSAKWREDGVGNS